MSSFGELESERGVAHARLASAPLGQKGSVMFIVVAKHDFVLCHAKGYVIRRSPTLRDLVRWMIQRFRNITVEVVNDGSVGVAAFLDEPKAYGRGLTLALRQ